MSRITVDQRRRSSLYSTLLRAFGFLLGAWMVCACAPIDAEKDESPWYEVLDQVPPTDLVPDEQLRGAIARSCHPWRVRHRQLRIEMVLVPVRAPEAPGALADSSPTEHYLYIARTELTHATMTLMDPTYTEPGPDLDPVDGVPPHRIQELGAAFGFRLPTVSEWVAVCRTAHSSDGIESSAIANCPDETYYDEWLRRTGQRMNEPVFGWRDGFGEAKAPVGSFPPDRAGLFDVIGNVYECATTTDQPAGAWEIDGVYYLPCGGAACVPVEDCHCGPSKDGAVRGDVGYHWLGFRLVREAD